MSQPTSAYRFVVVFLDVDGALGQAPVDPDWRAAIEHVRLAGIRRGRFPAHGGGGEGSVHPVWHPGEGAPRVAGVRATLRVDGRSESSDLPLDLFDDEATRALARLAEEGRVARGVRCRYVVRAYPRPPAACAEEGGLVVEEVMTALPVRRGRLADLAAPDVLGPAEAGDVPVVLPAAVIEEAARLAAAAGEVETGGILVGHLHRDPDLDDLVIEVTGQVPARHTVAERTRLTFTPETWAHVQTVVERRGRGEALLGFWHQHLAMCRDCPPERRATCALRTPFFSADDVLLQRTCFPQAWCVALLLSEDDDGRYQVNLFGWRQGRVRERGFRMTRNEPSDPRPAVPAIGADALSTETNDVETTTGDS